MGIVQIKYTMPDKNKQEILIRECPFLLISHVKDQSVFLFQSLIVKQQILICKLNT